MSYLAEVKAKVFELAEELRVELADVQSADEIPEIFDQWKKAALWPVVEAALKESYRNGVSDGAKPKPAQEPGERKPASWRKPRAKEAS